ncbi:MAG: RecX family transcriptional regulator [Clostridium sp.]|nr:RecX family transcriptional regulator [Clostridium sp.]
MIRKQKTITPEQALARLEDMCVAAEHCEGEMREKMRKWLISTADADKIITSLKQRRFIDDLRFARAYARDKYRFAHWGKRKIAMGLAAKRVDRDTIAEALSEINEEEYLEIARHALQAKMRALPDAISSYEGRTKLFRFLIGRGYDPSLASTLIKQAIQKN